ERSLGRFIDDKKAQQLKDKGSPIEGAAVVAGRTDKGVTAIQQVPRTLGSSEINPDQYMDASSLI
ncbi:hypothetical protein U1Q18_026694, partial [Sarracenia purpurea var. burkii]